MNTQETLQQFISQTLLDGREQIAADDDLLGEEIIDSMGVMQLIAFIEETFDCSVPQADITIFNFRTVDAIVTYLEKSLEKKNLSASVPSTSVGGSLS